MENIYSLKSAVVPNHILVLSENILHFYNNNKKMIWFFFLIIIIIIYILA